jgi:hypothetical protein
VISIWAVLGSVIFVVVLLAGAITALKGRWGLFLLGLATGGIIWPLTACALATPESTWSQSFYTADKRAEARRAFPRRTTS